MVPVLRPALPLLGSFVLALVAECSPRPSLSPVAERGAALYGKTCALCHGAGGEGYAADNATALASPTFLATASDAYLARSIARGRPGTTMSAWSTAQRGPYDDAQIRAIVAFIRSWQTAPTVSLGPGPTGGDAARGDKTYAARCMACHGGTGTQGPYVRLANPEFLAVASDAFLAYAIAHGRPGTKMPAFERDVTTGDIADLVALLRSWQKPVTPIDPRSIVVARGPIVVNPSGPTPAFKPNGFTPVETVAAELAKGAAMVILDARAPSDYVAGHIAGAIDVPFYEVDKHLDVLPKDRWIVCYCACPHAESGQAAAALRRNGYTNVTVLDEGFNVWRSRGHPVHSGTDP